MSKWIDLAGTLNDAFAFGVSGIVARSVSNKLRIRNNANTLDAPLVASIIAASGDDIQLNEDAAGSGADWLYTLRRPSSGMTQALVLQLPSNYGSAGQFLKTDGAGILSWDTATNVNINSTNNSIPYRVNSTTFGNSAWSYDGTDLIYSAPMRNDEATSEPKRMLQIVKNHWSPPGHPNLIWLEGSVANNVKGHAIELYWTKLPTNTYLNAFGGIVGEVTNESTVGTGTYGISIGVEHKGINATAGAYGGDFRAVISSGGQVDKAIGVNSLVLNYQNSTITSASLFKGSASVDGAGTVTPLIRGLDLSGWSLSGDGVIDRIEGIYISNEIDIGETTYAIKSDSTSASELAGSFLATSITSSGNLSGGYILNNDTTFDVNKLVKFGKTNWVVTGIASNTLLEATVSFSSSNNANFGKGLVVSATRNSDSAGTPRTYGGEIQVVNNSSLSHTTWGLLCANTQAAGANSSTLAAAGYFLFSNSGTLTTTNGQQVLRVQHSNTATGTCNLLSLVKAFVGNSTGGILTEVRGIDISGWSNSGTCPLSSAVYIGSDTGIGVTKYAINSQSTAPSLYLGDVEIRDRNLIFGTTTGTKIGTATSQKIGFYNATPVVQPVLNAYVSDTESVAYTGIDNLQVGSVYAQLSDLNNLRVAYENLRAAYDDLRSKLVTLGLLG